MRLHQRRPRELSSHRADMAVVIDVLRMTSTAAALMRRLPCARALVAATLDDLQRLDLPLSELFVISEIAGASKNEAWIDNSPARAPRIALGHRTPVLVTTNGTRTLLAAAACADRVLLASFIDLYAVAQHLTIAGPRSVLLVPAGHFESGEPRIEDDACADALASILTGRQVDLTAAEAAIRADPRVTRRLLKEPGLADDLDAALRPDAGATALAFHPRDERTGHIVRA